MGLAESQQIAFAVTVPVVVLMIGIGLFAFLIIPKIK
jgi:hypothetical protein